MRVKKKEHCREETVTWDEAKLVPGILGLEFYFAASVDLINAATSSWNCFKTPSFT
jgi:hypothetical protein